MKARRAQWALVAASLALARAVFVQGSPEIQTATLAAQPPALEAALYTGVLTIETTAATPIEVALVAKNGAFKALRQAVTNELGQSTIDLDAVDLPPSSRAILNPGDLLTLTIAGSGAFGVTVPRLVAGPDLSRSLVAGEAAAGDLVEMVAFDASGKALAAGQTRSDRAGAFRFAISQAVAGAFRARAWGDASLRRTLVPSTAQARSLAGVASTPRRWLHPWLHLPLGHRIEPGIARFVTRFEALGARVTLFDPIVRGRAARGVGLDATLLGAGGVWFNGRRREGSDRADSYELVFADGGPAHAIEIGDAFSITPSVGSGIAGITPRFSVIPDPATQTIGGLAPPGASVSLAVLVEPEAAPQPPIWMSTAADGGGQFRLPWTETVRLSTRSLVTAEVASGLVTYVTRGRAASVQASLYGTTISGTASPGGPVSITIIRPDGDRASFETRADNLGRFNLSVAPNSGQARSMQPGDLLLLGFGEAPAEQLLLPALDAVADTDTDQVSGTAPPGASVELEVVGQHGVVATVVADEAGRFAVNLHDKVDLKPRSSGLVRIHTGGGHAIILGWAVPGAELTVGSARLRGQGPPGQLVRVNVRRCGLEGGAGAATADVAVQPDGQISVGWDLDLRGADGASRALAPGDSVHLAIGQRMLEVGIPEVTIAANPALDFVTGLAPAGMPATVEFSRGGERERRPTTVGTDGRFLLELGDSWDLRAGDRLTLTLELASGYLLFVPDEVAGLVVRPEAGTVQGYASVGALVAAELRRTEPQHPDGLLVGSGRARANGFGGYDMTLSTNEGMAVTMQEGERLSIQAAAGSSALEIPPFGLQVNATTSQVTGRARPGTQVEVEVTPPTCNPTAPLDLKTVASSTDGTFEAALPGGRLVAGALVTARQRSPSGDMLMVSRRLPQFEIQVGGDLVKGRIASRSRLRAEIWRGSAAVAAADRQAGIDGTFECHLPFLAPDALLPTDAVSLTWQMGDGIEVPSTGRFAAVLPDIRAALDVGTHQVTGVAPAGAVVWLVPSGTGLRQDRLVLRTTADAAGHFTATYPANQADRPLAAGSSVEAGVEDASGNRLFARAVAPYLEAVIGGSAVAGRASPMARLRLELWRAGRSVASAEARSDTYGQFDAAMIGLQSDGRLPVAIADQVRLFGPDGRETRLVVPPLTVLLDREARQIRGTAPALAAIEVLVYVRGRDAASIGVTADGGGRWSVSDGELRLRGVSFDLSTQAEARLLVDNGHSVVANSAPLPTAVVPPSPTPKLPSPTPTALPPAPTPTATATPSAPPGATPVYLPWAVVRVAPPNH